MDCTHHITKKVQFICLAPHKCAYQRKLCESCIPEHKTNGSDTIPITQFQKDAINKLQEATCCKTFEQSNMLLKIKHSNQMKKLESTLRDFVDIIKNTLKQIQMEYQKYRNLVNENTNLAESSYSDIEKIFSLIRGEGLNDWKEQSNIIVQELEKIQNQCDQEIEAFIEKVQEQINYVKSLYIQPRYETKDNLSDILDYVKVINEQNFNEIVETRKQEKILDLLRKNSQQQGKNNSPFIVKILENIQNHDFNKKDYSTENYAKTRQLLIQQISQDRKIIQFLIFLVHLTAYDQKFIQCGSNSLNILVQMRVDLTNKCFENIKIRNTSLIGGNFARCNLSGSEFDNVDISGVNLNGTLLLNCKWRNIKMHEYNQMSGHGSSVNSVCISHDGTTLASGSGNPYTGDGDCSINLWDAKTGQLIAQLDGHNRTVYSVCFSPDGATLASGSADNSIRLWDVQTGKQKVQFDGHSKHVKSVCFSPDGKTLASGSDDKSILFWDVKTEKQKVKLEGHGNCVRSVCFSPDGTILASGSADNSILLWDVKTEKQKVKLEGHKDCVRSVCFSPDGTILASGSADNSILLWDVKTRKQKAKLEGHSGSVRSVCFSPDGNVLASCSTDKSILLWDIQTRKQQSKLDGHSDCVRSLCYSLNGIVKAQIQIFFGLAENNVYFLSYFSTQELFFQS